MSVIWKGASNVTLANFQRQYDPINGVFWNYEFRGPSDAIAGLAHSFNVAGNATVNTNHDGPIHIAQVTMFASPPADVWEVSYESLDKDGFFHPTVAADAASTGTGKAGEYRFDLEEALAKGDPASSSWSATKQAMYYELCRGAAYFEDEYIVLRGTKVVPRNAPGRFTIGSGQIIYQTTQLPLPADIGYDLPGVGGNAFPDNPPNARWGWKRRGYSVRYQGFKAEISVEFCAAAWSTLYYPTNATGNFRF